MAEKNINARIINKHDTEANWSNAINFIPKKGELIIYDADSTHSYERIKVGDGTTVVSSLPFADDTKVDKVSGKGLSTNDYTTAEKNKLAGIAEGANKTVVDSALSSTSTNPVQNKVVNSAISNLNTLIGDTSVAIQISDAIAGTNYAGSSSVGGSANSAVKATQDSDGNQINTTYVKKTGSTMRNLNSLLADASTTTAIPPNATAVASSPFARDLWHDHFAFLSSGYSLQNNQTTTNGSTWTDSTTNLKGLFQQKDKIAIQILDASTLARRFTLYSSQLTHSSIGWYEIGVAYTSPFSEFEIHIEASTDNSTWTTIHKSTITSNSKPYFLKGDSVGSNKYLRFTFTKESNITTGLISLTCLKGFTMRKGNQGLGIENEYPYDWDANRNIYPHNDNVRSLGTSSLRWASVYATNFVGTASKATSDANGNNIVNTYAKKPVITTITISIPTTGWTKNSTYGAYTQVFTATGATTDADLYIDCPVGSKFPLVGARCLESNQITLYMSDIPTMSQSITVKIKKEG